MGLIGFFERREFLEENHLCSLVEKQKNITRSSDLKDKPVQEFTRESVNPKRAGWYKSSCFFLVINVQFNKISLEGSLLYCSPMFGHMCLFLSGL